MQVFLELINSRHKDFGFIFCFLFTSVLFPADQGDYEVITNIVVCIVAAAVLGFELRLLK